MILKLSALPSARPPETTRDAVCRSGRPVAAAERETKRVCVGSCAFDVRGFDAGAAAGSCRLERRRAHGRDELLVLRRFHRDHRVAGVHGPTELVRGLDRHDVAQLTDTEQRGDARHQVLAERRRGTEHVRVVRPLPQRPAARARRRAARRSQRSRSSARASRPGSRPPGSRRHRRQRRAPRRRSARPGSGSRRSRTWRWRD